MTALTTIAPPTRRRVTRLAAVAGAAVATSACFLAGRAAGVDFRITDPGATEAHQLILPEIIGFTVVFALLGWGVLALLERRSRRARAIWTGVAVAVLLLS